MNHIIGNRLINYLYDSPIKKGVLLYYVEYYNKARCICKEEFTMKIQEVMNKYPVTVGKDAPISDVADLLVKYNLTAVSVVDDNNKLLGIISEGDLLYKKVRPHVPHYVNVLGASIYYNGIGEYNAQFKKLLASHVHELMTDEVITTTPDKDVEEIVSVMLDQHLKNVPVVDKDYRLIGILSRRDIIKLIAKDN